MKTIKFFSAVFFLLNLFVFTHSVLAAELQVFPAQASQEQQTFLQDKAAVGTVAAGSLAVLQPKDSGQMQKQQQQLAAVEKAVASAQPKSKAVLLDAAAQKQWESMLAGANQEFGGMEKSFQSKDRKRDSL